MKKDHISLDTLQVFLEESLTRAIDRHKLELSPSAQHYLKGMLEHFGSYFEDHDTLLTPITFQYLRVTEQLNKLKRTKLQRELGDHCLFLVGYFYDFVYQAGEGMIEYHTSRGSSAYKAIGIHPFTELSEKFNELYLVIGDLHLPQLSEKKILDIYGKWLETGDRYYESLLMGKGITPKKIRLDGN